jgi:hypothetical protein
MWKTEPTDDFNRQLKWYDKKKKNELKAVADNLDMFLKSLNDGRSPKPFVFGFLHEEPSDVIAIDQRGASTKVGVTRLYVYPSVATETLYLLTIGDKQTQNDDIQLCKRMVAIIKAEIETDASDEEREDDRANQDQGQD